MTEPSSDPVHTGADRNVAPNAPNPSELSTVQLVERLTEQVSTLVRTEISAGLDEVKSKGTRLGIGIGISSAGALLALFGLGTLIAAGVLGLATVVAAWLAALIVAVAVLLLGGALAAVGAARAKKALPPVPQDTAASVTEDISIIKKGIR